MMLSDEAFERIATMGGEIARLRKLLGIAREGLMLAVEGFSDRNHRVYFDAATYAFRCSDPDAPATADAEEERQCIDCGYSPCECEMGYGPVIALEDADHAD